MNWLDILKISTRDAIRDAERFAPAGWRWNYFYHGNRFFEEGKEEGLKQERTRL